MNANIEKALAAANDTRALWIGAGVSDRVAALFKEQFPAMPAVIVADTTTWQVLGEKVSRLFSAAGIIQESPFIFDNDDLYAEYGFVEQLTASLSNHTAIPVAVGSGTINDLTKLSAYRSSGNRSEVYSGRRTEGAAPVAEKQLGRNQEPPSYSASPVIRIEAAA